MVLRLSRSFRLGASIGVAYAAWKLFGGNGRIHVVDGLVEGNVNVDFEDVKTIMGEQGQAMMGTSIAAGAMKRWPRVTCPALMPATSNVTTSARGARRSRRPRP